MSKGILNFIREERKLKAEDDRHSDNFRKGFISACNIIESEIERTYWDRTCKVEGCCGVAYPQSDYCKKHRDERRKDE